MKNLKILLMLFSLGFILSSCAFQDSGVDFPEEKLVDDGADDDNGSSDLTIALLFADPLDGLEVVTDKLDCPKTSTAVEVAQYIAQYQSARIQGQVLAMSRDPDLKLAYIDDVKEKMAITLSKFTAVDGRAYIAAGVTDETAKEIYSEIVREAVWQSLIKDSADLPGLVKGYICLPTQGELIPCNIDQIIEFLYMIKDSGGMCGPWVDERLELLKRTDCAEIDVWENYYDIYCNAVPATNCEIYIAEMRLFVGRGDIAKAIVVYMMRRDGCTAAEVTVMERMLAGYI